MPAGAENTLEVAPGGQEPDSRAARGRLGHHTGVWTRSESHGHLLLRFFLTPGDDGPVGGAIWQNATTLVEVWARCVQACRRAGRGRGTPYMPYRVRLDDALCTTERKLEKKLTDRQWCGLLLTVRQCTTLTPSLGTPKPMVAAVNAVGSLVSPCLGTRYFLASFWNSVDLWIPWVSGLLCARKEKKRTASSEQKKVRNGCKDLVVVVVVGNALG